jgi:hypothetical protein
MPGILYIQSNSASAGSGSGAVNLPCAYTGPNSQGNLLLAWVVTDDATVPSSLTDTLGNTWSILPPYLSNLGTESWWVCPNCKVGANTVTANGLTYAATGGPNIAILEYQPPPCPVGTVGIQAFQPTDAPNAVAPMLGMTSVYGVSQGQFYHTLIVGLFDGIPATDGTARTWSATLDPNAIAGGLRVQFAEPSGATRTGAVADSTVPYPYATNSLSFTYSPSSPAVGNDDTLPSGLLVTTLA